MTNNIIDIATNFRFHGIILESFEAMPKPVFVEIGYVGSYNFADYKVQTFDHILVYNMI